MKYKVNKPFRDLVMEKDHSKDDIIDITKKRAKVIIEALGEEYLTEIKEDNKDGK